MVEYKDLVVEDIDLSDCEKRHSADKVIIYKTVGEEKVGLGLYYPKNYDKNNTYKLFVMVHGGGWQSHKIFEDQENWAGDHLGYLARYYAEKGFFVASIDYRLMRECGQPENYQIIDLYDDCFEAVEYLKSISKEYGFTFDNSIVLGESAGGYLAAALATFRFKGEPSFSKAILVNAITDFNDSNWYVRLPKKSNHPRIKDMSLDERCAFLSPVRNIDETTCKTLLIHGACDSCVYPRNSQSFYDEMHHYKRECDLVWIKDTNHAFLLDEYYKAAGLSLKACYVGINTINEWLNV